MMRLLMIEYFRDIRDKIPAEGFIKVVNPRVETLTAEQRTVLIRKGNALYNAGEYEKAKRIFLTTGYSDGLIRLGDRSLKENDPFEALRLYKIAPARDKANALIEKMAGVLKRWIND